MVLLFENKIIKMCVYIYNFCTYISNTFWFTFLYQCSRSVKFWRCCK